MTESYLDPLDAQGNQSDVLPPAVVNGQAGSAAAIPDAGSNKIALGTRLMQTVLDAKPEVFMDQFGTGWIRLPGERQAVRLGSRRVEDWITGLVWDNAQLLATSSVVQQICRVLRSKAARTAPVSRSVSDAWDALSDEPCLQVLQEFLERQDIDQHECLSSELYEKLGALADELRLNRGGRHWPKSAGALTSKFEKFKDALGVLGITFHARHIVKGTRVTLRRSRNPERPDDSTVSSSATSSAPNSLADNGFDVTDKGQPETKGQDFHRRLLEIKEKGHAH